MGADAPTSIDRVTTRNVEKTGPGCFQLCLDPERRREEFIDNRVIYHIAVKAWLVVLGTGMGMGKLIKNVCVGLASLACAPDVTSFGLTLPMPGKMAEPQSGYRAAWLSPGQWLILSPHQAGSDVAASLGADVGAGTIAKITEQTDGWGVLDLTAPDTTSLQQVLAHLVNLPARA